MKKHEFEGGGDFPSGDLFDGMDGEDLPPEGMIEEASLLAAEGDFEGAFYLAQAAAESADEVLGGSDTAAAALDLAAFCAIEGGAEEQAEEMIAELRKRNRPLEADFQEARLRFYQWNFDAAARLLRSLPEEGGRAPEINYFRAILAEFEGRFEDADRLYFRASSDAPESFSPPFRLSDAELDEVVHETLNILPGDFRTELENVVIEVADLPDPQKDAKAELHPLMLGLFEGPALGEESVFDPGGLPPRIRVFRKNLERVCTSREEAVDELARTLYHEIGHRLGFDEEGLEELDLD